MSIFEGFFVRLFIFTGTLLCSVIEEHKNMTKSGFFKVPKQYRIIKFHWFSDFAYSLSLCFSISL